MKEIHISINGQLKKVTFSQQITYAELLNKVKAEVKVNRGFIIEYHRVLDGKQLRLRIYNDEELLDALSHTTQLYICTDINDEFIQERDSTVPLETVCVTHPESKHHEIKECSSSGGKVLPSGKWAFLIGNTDYKYLRPLVGVINDLEKLSDRLTTLSFTVLSVLNLTQKQTLDFIKGLSDFLKPGGNIHILIYVVGHGFMINNETFLLTPEFQQNRESDHTICIEDIVNKFQDLNPEIFIMMVSVCRTKKTANVFTKARKESKGKPNHILCFSTCPGHDSFEIGRISYLVKVFLQELKKDPKVPIGTLFNNLERYNTDLQTFHIIRRFNDCGRSLADVPLPVLDRFTSLRTQYIELKWTCPERKFSIKKIGIEGKFYYKLKPSARNTMELTVILTPQHAVHKYHCTVNVKLIRNDNLQLLPETTKDVKKYHYQITNLQVLENELSVDLVVQYTEDGKTSFLRLRYKLLDSNPVLLTLWKKRDLPIGDV